MRTLSALAWEAGDLGAVISSLLLPSKKHGHLKLANRPADEQAMGWLEEVRNKHGPEKWLELIETLQRVTEGEFFHAFILYGSQLI